MYKNLPFDSYVGIADGDAHVFRKEQTPSIFHTFLLPPDIKNNKHRDVYIKELGTKINNCQQQYEHCEACPKIMGNGFGREHAEIDQTSILIQTSEDFVTQSYNTVLFLKVVFCLSIIMSVLKIIRIIIRKA